MFQLHVLDLRLVNGLIDTTFDSYTLLEVFPGRVFTLENLAQLTMHRVDLMVSLLDPAANPLDDTMSA